MFTHFLMALAALQAPTIASLRITPSKPIVVAHDTLRIRAEALDASGTVVSSAKIRFVNAGFANAARSIANIDVLPVQGINVYDILRRKKLVLTKAAIEALEARFK